MGNYTKMFCTPQTLNLSLDSTQLRWDVAELLQYILYLLNGLKWYEVKLMKMANSGDWNWDNIVFDRKVNLVEGQKLKWETKIPHGESTIENWQIRGSDHIPRLHLERRQWLKINLISASLFHFLDKGLYPHLCEGFNSPMSHNISDHLSKLHRHTIITASPEAVVNMRIKAIRRVLKKQYVKIFFFTCSQ